jgi:UDP-N-acetyl-2-amino-2-deoxyglucuronate dehydrogenase
MGNRLGFAIIGPGIIAANHQHAIRACADLGAELVCMAHYNPDRFPAIEAQFGVPCVTLKDALADPRVDAVAIGTPSGQHAAQTIAAAQAGKHVLVEKPIATTLPDADAMIAACEQAGVKLGVMFQSRTRPFLQQIKAAVDGGDLGALTLGMVVIPYRRDAAYYNLADWRGTWAQDGGGVLTNQGIHEVDLLVWLMGDPVDVQAHAGTLVHAIEVEDTLTASLRFAGSALGTITAATTAGPGFPRRVEVYGTNGGIQLEGDTVTRWTLVDETRQTVTPPAADGAVAAGGSSDPMGIGRASHVALFRDFVQAVYADRPPLIDGQEGRRSLAVVQAVYTAAGLR